MELTVFQYLLLVVPHYIHHVIQTQIVKPGRATSHKAQKGQPYPCPNSLCKHQYATGRSLRLHLAHNQACADCVECLPTTSPAVLDSPPTSPRDPAFPDDDGLLTRDGIQEPWGDCIGPPWDSSSEEDSDACVDEQTEDASSVVGVDPPPNPGTDLSCYGVTFTNSDLWKRNCLKYSTMPTPHIFCTRMF